MLRRSVALIAAATLVAGVALGWFLRRPPRAAEEPAPELPAIGLHEATIILRHQGTRQAEVRADRVQVSRDLRYATFAGNPTAVVFNQGRAAVRASGSGIVLDRHTSDVTVEGPVEVTTLEATPVDQGRLRANHLRYDSKAKAYLAEGNVRLTIGDMEVSAQRLRLEQISETLFAFDDVRVVQGDVTLTAATVTYYLRSQVAQALGDPTLVRGATTLRAPQMEFNLEKRQTIARGGVSVSHKDVAVSAPELHYDASSGEARAQDVVVTQPDRTVRAQRLRYIPESGRLELEGRVVVEQSGGNRLVEEGVVDPPRDDEARRMLSAPTVLTCERLVILTEQRTVEAQGGVTVTQEGRSASAASGSYSDRDRRLMLRGGVVLTESNGHRLSADQVVISLADETFEASGNVVTEFVLKRGK